MSENESRGKSKLKAKKNEVEEKENARWKVFIIRRGQIGHWETTEIHIIFKGEGEVEKKRLKKCSSSRKLILKSFKTVGSFELVEKSDKL